MRRFFIILGVFILLFAINQTKAFATAGEDIYKESGALTLEEQHGGTEQSFGEKTWDILGTALTGGATKAIKYASLILACLLALSVAKSMRQLRDDDKSGTAYDFVSAAVLGATAFPAVYSVFTYTKAAIESMNVFCLALIPVNASLYSLGGNPTQAVTASGGMSLFLTATETVNAKLLLPLLSVGFAFALLGLLPGAENMAPFGGFIKNCATTLIAFVFSLVCFVFYFQTAIAASADGFGYRTVKFATGTFIPLIGNSVGDSARTVFGAVSTVKASVGTLGLCVVMGYLLPPFVQALFYKASFAFCATFARFCGLEKQARFISELGSLLGVSLALLVATGVVFTVISAVFLKSGATV